MATSEPMDLKAFVSETLKELMDGIRGAQDHAKELAKEQGPKYAPRVNPWNMFVNKEHNPATKGGRPVQQVTFDLAVTVNETKGKQVGIGVLSGILCAGGRTSSQNSNSRVSRITFSVPIIFPLQE